MNYTKNWGSISLSLLRLKIPTATKPTSRTAKAIGGSRNTMVMVDKLTTRIAINSGSSGNTMPTATKPTSRTAMAIGASGNTIPTATKHTSRTAKATKKAHLGANRTLVK